MDLPRTRISCTSRKYLYTSRAVLLLYSMPHASTSPVYLAYRVLLSHQPLYCLSSSTKRLTAVHMYAHILTNKKDSSRCPYAYKPLHLQALPHLLPCGLVVHDSIITRLNVAWCRIFYKPYSHNLYNLLFVLYICTCSLYRRIFICIFPLDFFRVYFPLHTSHLFFTDLSESLIPRLTFHARYSSSYFTTMRLILWFARSISMAVLYFLLT